MRDSTVKWLSAIHRFVLHQTRGRVGGRLVNNDMLLLTTTGTMSGAKHTVPLLYLTDGDAYIVVASYGGRPEHPQWYRNLVAAPQVSAQIGSTTIALEATTVEPAQRHQWWPMIIAAYSDYAVYQSRTTREIPIVRLAPV